MSEPDAAWIAFCRALEQAGAVLRRPAIANDAQAQAEGQRHLVRLIRMGFEVLGEYGDPRHPRIFPMADETLLSEGVTSDARYHQAFIDGTAFHSLEATRGSAPLVEIGVYEGRMGFHASTLLQGCLTEADLEVGDDGRFVVGLGPEPRPGNWIRTDARSHYLFVRQYAHDWSETRSASFDLVRHDSPGPPPPLGPEEIRRALAQTAAFVARAPALWADVSDYWAGYAVNQLVAQEAASSDTDIAVPSGHRFACGYFRLSPHEALAIRFDPPDDAAYWGLHLDSYWYEPLSWRDNRAQLNDRTVRRNEDGSVTVVVADRAPEGAPNWLATLGHSQGTAVFRWSRSEAPCPVFRCGVAPTERWRDALGAAP